MRFLLPLVLLFIACSSSEPIVDQVTPIEMEESTSELTNDKENELPPLSTNEENEIEEYLYLSALSDTYFKRQNKIPSAYQRVKVEIKEEVVDLFEGYRIQIYSGPNVALADTVAKKFRAWSAANIEGYQAQTYTFFKAPFYRVHVGDFHDRNRAIDFSNLMKQRFRDSWVVFDRVNPYNVPSDTAQIIIKR